MIKHQNLPEEDDLLRKLRTILRQLPHKEQVQFALFCAEEANSELPEAKECVRLVKEWLKDSKSVTSEELRQAAYVADASATYTAWSAYASVYAADAAYASAYAAAATYANAAACAAYASAYAAYATGAYASSDH